MSQGWIGVDLDGTLAVYDGWKGPTHIGEPIPLMCDRVRKWLSDGVEVKIFTARVSHDGTRERIKDAVNASNAIDTWCRKQFGQELEITNMKDYDLLELWDDRCVQVAPNSGEVVGKSSRE